MCMMCMMQVHTNNKRMGISGIPNREREGIFVCIDAGFTCVCAHVLISVCVYDVYDVYDVCV